ncbi:MAG: hypothetical protein EXS10_07815 [Phycisphaerales bacterium]|nr:hypothetical protein [Phycisphaerales bacterium]
MTEPNQEKHYDLVPEDPDDRSSQLHAERVERAVEAQSRPVVTIPPSVDSIDEDAEDEASSLPPAISAASNARAWMIAALAVLAVVLLAWLAGAQGLVIPSASESPATTDFTILERLSGALRTMTFAVLSTAGFTFGICCLAFVRQRPLGDVLSLFAKCAFIASIGLLAWIIPCDFRILKQLLNNLGPLVAGCALYALLFRIELKDALVAIAYAVLGMTLLVFFSASVVWSTRL